MPQLTPSYLMDVEKRMRIVTARDYQRLNSKTWWNTVAKNGTMTGKAERLIFMLDTARIERVNRLGGEVPFEDMVATSFEIEAGAAAAGLKLNRTQFEDHDGGGLNMATHWSSGVGQYAAYWPQKQVALAIRNGGAAASVAYDGQIYFSGAHPNNPFDSSAGTYANDLTGAASGAFPGAVPIDVGVTLDVAFTNLSKAISYIQGALKMPNGEDPRLLKVAKLIVPPALVPRAQQLTNARYIAQAATGGGAAAADVESIVRNWGLGEPIEAPELGAAFGGSDTTYYLAIEEVLASEVGALTYTTREPFKVLYHGEMTDAQLARMNELQWMTTGRNVVSYGHPFLLFRCRAT